MSIPISSYEDDNILHIRIKLNGNREKLAFFNYAMEKLDFDWPLGPGIAARNANLNRPNICTDCGGWIWRRPNMSISDTELFARQVAGAEPKKGHMKLRFRKIQTEAECRKAHKKMSDQEELAMMAGV